MNRVKYEGSVPKSLRDWCDRNADKVYEVHAGSGYCTDSGFAYDVALRNGWRDGGDVVHSIIEPNVRETLAKLRGIVACDCKGCRAGEGYGTQAFSFSRAIDKVQL